MIDPVFSSFASPVFFVNKAFPGSNVYSARDFDAIDVLILSHDHWGHLDYPSVKALLPKVKHVVCPLGVGGYVEHWGLPTDKLIEEDWGTTIPIAADLAIHILPRQHFSGRLLKRNQTEWASFAFITPTRRVFLHRHHMLLPETAQASVDVQAKTVIPMHNGKFALSNHPWDEPYIRLTAESVGKPYRLLTPKIGEAVYIGSTNQSFTKWWEQMT